MRPKAAENRGKSTAKREWNVINKTEGPKGMNEVQGDLAQHFAKRISKLIEFQLGVSSMPTNGDTQWTHLSRQF